MEIIKLIGVLVVIVGLALKLDTLATVVVAGVITGLALKLDTLATVVVAGIITGLVSGMKPMEILTVLGNAFISQRISTLFVLALPVIGICERYGLKDKAVDLIKKIANATTGRILSLYLAIRVFAAATSLRIGGHIQFIRPLIHPMARGASVAKYKDIDEATEDDIKGLCAGVENFGNFFGQNCFLGASGTLLIVSTLTEQGINVDVLGVAMWSIPIAIASVVIGTVYFLLYDKKLEKSMGGK